MIWFRLHTKLLHDPRVQRLEPLIFKIYINCLCHASEKEKDGELGNVSDVSFALHETVESVSSAFHILEERGLIAKNETDDETFHIPQWRKKQYKSDISTDRVRKYRDKMKRSMKRHETVSETGTDTDTDTDIIKDTKVSKKTGVKTNGKSKRKQQIQTRFPTDKEFPDCPGKYQETAIGKGVTKWQPVWQKFYNNHFNKQNRFVSWHRAWQNWLDNHIEWGHNNSPNKQGRGNGDSVGTITQGLNLAADRLRAGDDEPF